MTKLRLILLVATVTLCGCAGRSRLPPVRVTIEPDGALLLDGVTVVRQELINRLRARQRHPADHFPVIIAGADGLTASQVEPVVDAVAQGFVFQIWFEWEPPGSTGTVVKTELPVPDGRLNDLNLVVLSTPDGQRGACLVYHTANGRRVSDTVTLDELRVRLAALARNRSIELDGVVYPIERREAWVQDEEGDGVRQLHPLIGISWHPEAYMKHVAAVMQICSALGFGQLVPLQVNQPPEVEMESGQQDESTVPVKAAPSASSTVR
jgi:hypothetical protein